MSVGTVGLRRREPDRAPDPAPDAGFTLVETLVSIAVIGVVMTSLTSFFTHTMGLMNNQRGTQTAVHLAQGALENARAYKGAVVVAGRGRTSAEAQWSAAPAAVAPYQANMDVTWDSTLPDISPAGSAAPLSTDAETIKINNVTYRRSSYVGMCYAQAIADLDPTNLTCTKLGLRSPTGLVKFFQVVVAVTWTDRTCRGGACSYVTSTLISSEAIEPVFNARPTPDPQGPQVDDTGVAVSLQLTATGGAAPLVWSDSGATLPGGLSVSPGGLISGMPNRTGVFPVTISVRDKVNQVGTVTFSWTVNPYPVVTDPGLQTAVVGSPASLTLSAGGTGTLPLTWAATGLPAGLSLGAGTNVISGTPTTAELKRVRVTVTDGEGQLAVREFDWNVVPALALTYPPANTTFSWSTATAQNVVLTATGGITPYTWSATNLPAGLTITTGGVISGTLTAGTRYLTTVTVVDARLATRSVTVVVNVAAGSNETSITGPVADRTGTVGAVTTVVATADTGGGSITWAVTGLPDGLSLSNGLITGRPTKAGVYLVKLTAARPSKAMATSMFVWTIS